MRRIKFSLLSSLTAIFLLLFKMAESVPVNPPADSSEAAVHIVYTERPTDEEPEAYHLRILSSLLGSDEAAKNALGYSYKTVASGFSAKLTPQQVERLSEQPGVLQVVPSETYELHGARPGGIGNIH